MSLWQTVRHLRPSQVLWRLRYIVEQRLIAGLGLSRARSAWRPPEQLVVRDDFPSIPRFPSSSLKQPLAIQDLDNGFLELLNERVEIGRELPDWRLGDCSKDRLWTVTLHYHEWFEALARAATHHEGSSQAETAAHLLRHYFSDWVERCGIDQPGASALAWNAYAIATRLGWWIRSYSESRSLLFEPGSELERRLLRSLWLQASYLNGHLEWHLRGNHLMRDAVGLAWAGRFLDGRRPRAWLEQATTLAVDQVAEQVLPDGGHFERSPGYHVEIMEDLLALALLVEDPDARASLRQAWGNMAEFLAWMRHPDGDIPLFNDAALRGADAVSSLISLGEKIGISVDGSPRRGGKLFADTGMVVWHGAHWALFFDVGPVGPDFQPGHAHADTLSIECSLAGRRLFVDPGSFSYDDDDRRRYDRGTEAHNTIGVDDTDSSEMWKIFRVGRRARPLDVTTEIRVSGINASAAHDGYDHLSGRPRHRRQVIIDEPGPLVVIDRIAGSGVHRIQGGFLVAPGWNVEQTAQGWQLVDGNLRVRVVVEGVQTVDRFLEQRPYHPRYGVEQQTTRIGWRWQGDLPLEVRTVVEPA